MELCEKATWSLTLLPLMMVVSSGWERCIGFTPGCKNKNLSKSIEAMKHNKLPKKKGNLVENEQVGLMIKRIKKYKGNMYNTR